MLFTRRNHKIIVFAAILFLFGVGVAFAANDGFAPAKKIEGKHFIIYYTAQSDVRSLSRQLNIRPSDELLVGGTAKEANSSEEQLTNMLDTLFLRVCDILDMNLYSFQGNIKICQDHSQLRSVYNNIFDKDLGNRESFYVYSFNTIYISAESFKREILGHEMAHAVISHYFVVLPSVKIQEVLSSYVEFQLRKIAQ
jgi:hypothetical protein